MQNLILIFVFLIAGMGYAHSAAAKESKPFFPLSAECQEHCESQGERVDFVDSKMESRCDCNPV